MRKGGVGGDVGIFCVLVISTILSLFTFSTGIGSFIINNAKNTIEILTDSINSSTTTNSSANTADELRFLSMEKFESSPNKTIRRIHLLGERNSGTNMINKYLRLAFSSRYPHFSYDIPVLENKHLFRHDLLNKTEIQILLHEIYKQEDGLTLWIMAVREPCEWADGMFRKPWHLCPPSISEQDCSQRQLFRFDPAFFNDISREQFFTAPIRDWKEVKKHGLAKAYTNIFELRAHKLRLMKQVMMLTPRLHYVLPFHYAEAAPYQWTHHLAVRYGLKFNTTTYHSTPNQSTKIHHTPLCLTEKEYHLVMSRIDWSLEATFGIHPSSCHICLENNTQTSTNF